MLIARRACSQVDYDAGRCVVADVPLERPLFEIDHVAEGQPYLLTVRAENEAGKWRRGRRGVAAFGPMRVLGSERIA